MIYLDTGHGQDSRRRGVYDPGAVCRGVAEADVVRDVAAATLARLQAGAVPSAMAPDGLLSGRTAWQRRTLTADDVLISVHLNGTPGGTGTEVFYSAYRPELRTQAAQLSFLLAARLEFRDRGAKPDTESAPKKLGILRASRSARTFLVELGFLDNERDRAAVVASGGAALTDAIVEVFRK